MPRVDPLRCPTCLARWGAEPRCRRCGADLSLLQRVLAQAWRRRDTARRALLAGDWAAAAEAARSSLVLQRCAAGRELLALAELAQRFADSDTLASTRRAARALAPPAAPSRR